MESRISATYLSLHYHIVFSTKDRVGMIASAWRDRLHAFLGGVVRQLDGIPEAIGGGKTFKEVLFGPVNWQALDRAGQPVRMRLSSTVMDVRHEGARDDTESVRVTYLKDGRLHRVRARGAVMASGQWVNKRVVKDLPAAYREAMEFFYHAPMLTLNVAVRNWKFMEKLGIGDRG